MKTRVYLRSQRGAAFITTLVFTGLLMVLSASILTWSTMESRLNKAHQSRVTARNAAETLAEYGAAVAAKQLQEVTEYTTSFCSPGTSNTLLMSPARRTELFAGTNIDPARVEVVGQVVQINTPGGFHVDAADLANTYASSAIRGSRGLDGRLRLLATASTLPDATGRRQSIYFERTYTILDSPVLQYAAFYNLDLEIAPGPTFNIYGPVHTNRDLWVSKQSSSSVNLSFWETVTAVGKIQKGFKVQPIQANGGRETPSSDPVRFMRPSGSFENLYGSFEGSANMWRDQRMGTTTDQSTAFRRFTNSIYGDNTVSPPVQSYLQTSAHGVARRPLPGQLDNYVPDPNPTDAVIDSTYRNVPRALIERPLRPGDIEYIGPEVEMQKMSRKAGLYIIINASAAPIPPATARAPDGTFIVGGLQVGEYRAYVRDPSSTTLIPVYREVKLPGQPAWGVNTAHPWLQLPASILRPDVRPLILFRPGQMTDMRRFNHRTAANPTGFDQLLPRAAANIYQPKRINLIEVDMTVLRLAVDATVNTQPTTMIFPYDNNWDDPLLAGVPVNLRNTDPRYRSTYRSPGPPATALPGEFGVNTGAAPTTREGLYAHVDNRYQIAGMNVPDWDGSIYIESVDSDFLNAVDAVNPAPTGVPAPTWLRRLPGHRLSGVRLINGRGPVASAKDSLVNTVGSRCSPGITLSTNDPIYILGHLNADGDVKTTTSAPTAAQLNDPTRTVTDATASGNNSSLFRDPELIANAPQERPLALVGDAITILSQPTFDSLVGATTPAILPGAQTGGWNDSLSHIVNNSANYRADWRTTVADNNNQRDGWYFAPPASTKWILANADTRSPIERYNYIPPAPPTATTVSVYPPLTTSVATSNSSPAIDVKFPGARTEISAGFIIGIAASANNPADPTSSSSVGDGNNSGGLHNLPRFLENWSADCAIRGSMVVMFESQVAWEPWSLRMYGPPGRQWGFHNYFRNFYFSDDIPATRNLGISSVDQYQTLTQDQYFTRRAAMWGSHPTFITPP